MMGRSGILKGAGEGAEKLREEFHLGGQGLEERSWLRPAAEAR